jgi:hypothetical protein
MDGEWKKLRQVMQRRGHFLEATPAHSGESTRALVHKGKLKIYLTSPLRQNSVA